MIAPITGSRLPVFDPNPEAINAFAKAHVLRLEELIKQRVKEQALDPRWLTREQAGAYIGGNANSIRYLLEQKELREYGKGKEKKINKDELDRYFAENPHWNESYGSTRNGNGNGKEPESEDIFELLYSMFPPIPLFAFGGNTEQHEAYRELRQDLLEALVTDENDPVVWEAIDHAMKERHATQEMLAAVIESKKQGKRSRNTQQN